MIYLKGIFLLLIFLVINNCLAQVSIITGKVIDKDSKKSLSGVVIKIGEKRFLTNNNGNFSIKYDIRTTKDSAITFTYIGYKDLSISSINGNIFLIIELSDTTYTLKDIIISTASKSIVKKAISNIPLNYSTTPFILNGFQRIYEQINDSDFFYKNEALLSLYFNSYENSKEKIQIGLIQNRSDTINNFDTITVKRFFKNVKIPRPISYWSGDYYLQSELDFVYNRFPFISNEFIDSYNYYNTRKVLYEGTEAYAIDFSTKDDAKGHEGTLFIDTISYAFVGAIIFNNNKSLEESKQKIKFFKDDFVMREINFKKINNKWYFKNSHFEQRVIPQNKSGENNDIYKSIIDFVSIEIDSSNVSHIERKDRILKSDRAFDLSKPVSDFAWCETLKIIDKKDLSKYLSEIPIPQKRN